MLMRMRSILRIAALVCLTLGTAAILLSRVFESQSISAFHGIFNALPAEANGLIIFVDDSATTGANNGSSWTNAYVSLRDGLVAATSGYQIWVAEGIYYPDIGSGVVDNARTETFTLINGVAVYGGFAGAEIALSERDWMANVTVLSGDIDQNDTTDGNGVVTDPANIAGSNAYHAVTGGGVTGSAILDGFTITAGQANGSSWPGNSGGGMLNLSSSPTLSNVSFTGNQAMIAGGMYNDNSSPTLTNMIFSGNEAVYEGGGIYNNSGSNPTLSGVRIHGNKAGTSGGGMLNFNSSPTMTNITISGNQATNSAGGLYNYYSSPTMTNVTFSGNQNGAISNDNSNPTISNAILWNNQVGASSPQITNSNSTPLISYSDVQFSNGSGPGWDTYLGTDGGGNLDADPLFVMPVDPYTAPTVAGDLRLRAGSAALDAGSNGDCPAFDLAGNLRPIDGDLNGTATCDMGAYEKTIDLFLPLILR